MNISRLVAAVAAFVAALTFSVGSALAQTSTGGAMGAGSGTMGSGTMGDPAPLAGNVGGVLWVWGWLLVAGGILAIVAAMWVMGQVQNRR